MVLTIETDAIYNYLVNNPDTDVSTIGNALRQEKKQVNRILYKRRDLFTSTTHNSKHIKRPYWSIIRREITCPSIITPRQPINSTTGPSIVTILSKDPDREMSVLEEYNYNKFTFGQQVPVALPVSSDANDPVALPVNHLYCQVTDSQREPLYTIPQALALIFQRHQITSKQQLFDWCLKEGVSNGCDGVTNSNDINGML